MQKNYIEDSRKDFIKKRVQFRYDSKKTSYLPLGKFDFWAAAFSIFYVAINSY